MVPDECPQFCDGKRLDDGAPTAPAQKLFRIRTEDAAGAEEYLLRFQRERFSHPRVQIYSVYLRQLDVDAVEVVTA
jgi:hypothetical protein